MLDGPRDDRVGDAGKGTGEIVLGVGEAGVHGGVFRVEGFEAAASFVEGAELDADLLIERVSCVVEV